MFRQAVRFVASNTTGGPEPPSQLDTENQQEKGWLSRILTGAPYNPEGVHKQSHSSMLSVSDAIFELQSLYYEITESRFLAHDVHGDKDEYLKRYKQYTNELKSITPGADIIGSWYVMIGNQNQLVHLWRFGKYSDVDR
jgi:hypothetical protein